MDAEKFIASINYVDTNKEKAYKKNKKKGLEITVDDIVFTFEIATLYKEKEDKVTIKFSNYVVDKEIYLDGLLKAMQWCQKALQERPD